MTDRKYKTRNAPPSACSMIESLRGLGYSTSTALADIIDNSLTAGANRVDLHFIWNGERQAVAILDNGHGMSDNELFDAMRLGFLSPLSERTAHDLGRFGLGLKTASFSQCRSLTVASKRKNGDMASLRWDLDHLLQIPAFNGFCWKSPVMKRRSCYPCWKYPLTERWLFGKNWTGLLHRVFLPKIILTLLIMWKSIWH